MNQKIVALGILFMIISGCLYFSARTVMVRDWWWEYPYFDAQGNPTSYRYQQENRIFHPAEFVTVYPYAWIGIVMFLIGLAVVGIGAVLSEPETIKEKGDKKEPEKKEQIGGFFR